MMLKTKTKPLCLLFWGFLVTGVFSFCKAFNIKGQEVLSVQILLHQIKYTNRNASIVIYYF